VKQRKHQARSADDRAEPACKRALSALFALDDAYQAVASSGDPVLLREADKFMNLIRRTNG